MTSPSAIPEFDACPADLQSALEAAAPRLGPYGRLRYLESVSSTNDVALALAHAGAPEGTSVLASHQRLGRGRRGRAWQSPPDSGLYLSVVLRPDGEAAWPLVTLGAGAAVAEAIGTACGLVVELKWPNDVVCGRPWRKVGGLLAESALVGSRVEVIVVGIGVNVRRAPLADDLRNVATSLEDELGRRVDSAALVVEMLVALRRVVDELRAGRAETVSARWRQYGSRGLGGAVRWTDGGAERRGRAVDIAADGALLVDAGGRTERLVAGDVQWEHAARG